MFQRVCDRCGAVLKDPMIGTIIKNSEWKGGPEMHFEIYGPEGQYDRREGHLCRWCCERFTDWIYHKEDKDE